MSKVSSRKAIAGSSLVAIISAFMIIAAAAPLASGSHTADRELEPKKVKGDSRILFKITVSNSSGSADNIDNIWISGPAFTEPIGGSAVGENMENAADNLDTASTYLSDASGYMSDAGSAVNSAGSSIAAMKSYLESVESYLAGTDYDNFRTKLSGAKFYLERAGDELSSDPENLDYVEGELDNAGYLIIEAAGDNLRTWDHTPPSSSNWENFGENYAAENLITAGDKIRTAADKLKAGNIKAAKDKLSTSVEAMDNAGYVMESTSGASTNVQDAGSNFRSAADEENSATASLSNAYDNLVMTGRMFGEMDTPENAVAGLWKAGDYLEDISYIGTAGDNFKFAAKNLDNAADNLIGTPEDIFQAGDNISLVADAVDNAGSTLMKALGGSGLQDAGTSLSNAADNMRYSGMLDLGTAASNLSDSAGYISSASDDLKSSGSDVKATPSGWEFHPGTPDWTAIGATGENTLAPGESETFPILFRTGATGENSFTVYTHDTAGATDSTTYTVSVDNTKPYPSSARVYQSGVGENNMVGDVYDNGKATLEITWNESLSSIGDVEIYVDGENVTMPLSLENTGNKTFTGEFDVKEWDDNTLGLWVESATDTMGLENSIADNIINFDVDTRAPTWDEDGNANENSGLSDAKDAWATWITGRDQTPENVYATDNGSWTINGEISDNSAGSWSGVSSVEVLVNGSTVETATLPDNTFSADDVDLGSEGVKAIKVEAVDVTGNVLDNSLDNVLYDTAKASIDTATLAPENGAIINDDTAAVSVVVKDSGLGIDNATLRYDNSNGRFLDNADNFAASVTLENASAWTGDAWSEETHKIWVYADDKLHDNVTATWSFSVDVTTPSESAVEAMVDDATFRDPTTAETIKTVTSKSEIEISGTAVESGSKIEIFKGKDGAVIGSKDLASGEKDWSITVTFEEDGTYPLYIQETDEAGNKSEKVLMRTQTIDTAGPSVTISKPKEGLKTGKNSVVVEGEITDEISAPGDITVTLSAAGTTKEVTLKSDGSFSTSVPVASGKNVVNVTAEDEAGNTTVKSRTVTRTVPTNWAVYATIAAIIAIILAAIAVARRS